MGLSHPIRSPDRDNSLSILVIKRIKQLQSEIFCVLYLQAVRHIALDLSAGCCYDLSTVTFSKNRTLSPELNWINKTKDE